MDDERRTLHDALLAELRNSKGVIQKFLDAILTAMEAYRIYGVLGETERKDIHRQCQSFLAYMTMLESILDVAPRNHESCMWVASRLTDLSQRIYDYVSELQNFSNGELRMRLQHKCPELQVGFHQWVRH